MLAVDTTDEARFTIHRELLRHDSNFLRSPLILHRTGMRRSDEDESVEEVRVNLTSEQFGFYADILYRSLLVPQFSLVHTDLGVPRPLLKILELWQTAVFASSTRLILIAEQAFVRAVLTCTPGRWHYWWRTRGGHFVSELLEELQHCYYICRSATVGVPMKQEIENACANMPQEMFAIFATELEGELARRVVRHFALKLAGVSEC